MRPRKMTACLLGLALAMAFGLGQASAASVSPAGQPPYDIFSMLADGSQQTDLTNDPPEDMRATWSPDGSKIAYARFLNTTTSTP